LQAVVSVEDVLPPVLVFQIPLHGFSDAGVEGFLGCPAELALDFGGVDGVALVVAGAVGDVGDEVGVAGNSGGFSGGEFFEQGADGADDFEVGFFVVAADVVGFAGFSVGYDGVEGAGVVFDIQPVADLAAVAVDGQGFAGEGVEDDVGDEFFGEVAWAVVVGAVGDEGGQAVGALPGAHEVVAGCFAGGVGAGRGVGGGFGEEAV